MNRLGHSMIQSVCARCLYMCVCVCSKVESVIGTWWYRSLDTLAGLIMMEKNETRIHRHNLINNN